MSLKQKIFQEAQLALNSKFAFLLYEGSPKVCFDNGFKFIMHYYNLSVFDDLKDAPIKKGTDPLLPPFDQHMNVTNLDHHHIIINKFMQCKGHIIMSSMGLNEKQDDNLNMKDFQAFSRILKEFDNKGIAYYNCGSESGCSQSHKHLQYSPIEETPILDDMILNKDFPFIYHVSKVKNTDPNELNMVYNDLLKQAKNDPPHNSYNFIIAKGYAVYLPRSKSISKYGNVMNSFAATGNYSIWQWGDPKILTEPLSVLKDVCFLK